MTGSSIKAAGAMTTSSKPTPGPTAQYFHEPADRGRLCVIRRKAPHYTGSGEVVARHVELDLAKKIAQLLNNDAAVNETGLTPQQMREQRDELLAELKRTDEIVETACAHLRRCAVLLSEAGDDVSASNVRAWIENVTRRDHHRTDLIVKAQISAAIAKAEGGVS